ERHRRDGRGHQASFPTRRREHELLELRPAVGLQEHAMTDRMGKRVDRDPVRGLTRGSPQELPRTLGICGQQTFEETEGEPADLEEFLAKETIGHEQELGWSIATGRVTETAR